MKLQQVLLGIGLGILLGSCSSHAPNSTSANAVLSTPKAAPQMAESMPAAPARVPMGMAAPQHMDAMKPVPNNTEKYAKIEDNPVKKVSESPVSTFSIDVDTGSYSNVRRMLNHGTLPNPDAVRVEEMLNYFPYDYPLPTTQDPPFSVNFEIAPTPWNKNTRLLHVSLKGYDVPRSQLPPANLVFLIDVSGSMMIPNKIELLKPALKMLTEQLRPQDKVALVVYAGTEGVVLEPTSGEQKDKIFAAIDRLNAGGSTNGGAGIKLAYSVAQQGFIQGGVNRILLATDGDFNVGLTDKNALKSLIEEKRKGGISLSTLGFGMDNYNDELMEQLADVGNGNYAYIDTLNEARKVLVEEMSSTLNTIAKDVKIQVEFNPAVVAEYRLLGYENRALKREDFSNDKVDAGEIGAGRSVTALYELSLVDGAGQRLEPLRYGVKTAASKADKADELGLLRLRYKLPSSEQSKLLEYPMKRAVIKSELAASSERFRFAAAVAAFGQQLRGGKYLEQFSYDSILDLGRDARGEDRFGYRAEFLNLVSLAKALSTKPRQ